MEEQNLKDLLNTERTKSRRGAQPDAERKKAMADRRFGNTTSPNTSVAGGKSAEASQSILKNSEESRQAADALHQSRRAQRASTVDPLTAYSPRVDDSIGSDPGGAYDVADKFSDALQEASTPDAKTEALQAAYHMARVLRDNAKSFSHTKYILVLLFIAVPLDLLAIPLDMTGPLKWAIDAVTGVVRFFLWIVVSIFLAGRGTKIKSKVIIWAIGVVSSFFEIVPLVDIVPFYSINVLVAWALAWRESMKNKEAARKLEKQIKKMKKSA